MTKRKKKKLKYNNIIITLIVVIALIFGLYQTITSFIVTNRFIRNVTGPVIGTVVLDAGHGDNDVGCMNGSFYEKDITLEYVREIGNYLMKNGVQVYYTRTDDNRLGSHQKDDLQARCDLAYEKRADYFISIHVNAVEGNKEVSGFEVYYYGGNEKSFTLAKNVSNCMEELNYSKNRGVLEGNSLYVIKNNEIDSILIELGYIRSTDIKYLTNNSKTKKLSKKIAEGIIDSIKEK